MKKLPSAMFKRGEGLMCKLRNRRIYATTYANGDVVIKWKSLKSDGIAKDGVRLSPEGAAATCRLLVRLISMNPKMYELKESKPKERKP